MDENNKFNLLTKRHQTQQLNKIIDNKHSLFSRTYSQKHLLDKPALNEIKDKINDSDDNKTNINFEKSLSLLKLFSNKSNLFESYNSRIIRDNNRKGKTCSFTVKNNLYPIKNKKASFFLSNKKNNFYLTSSLNNSIKNNELKNCNSAKFLNINEFNNDNMIDLIHDKEIKVCLDLIKSFPENKRKKNKSLKSINNCKSQETDNLIKMIKNFNIDNITNQRIIENEIKKNYNFKPEINPINTLSMSTNYKTNNMKMNNSKFKFNISNYSNNLNSSLISFKNNNDSNILKQMNDSNILNKMNDSNTMNKMNDSNIINNNNSSYINNNNLTKTKMIRSINNKMNSINSRNMQTKMKYDQRNEINFHTGFVRKQKKIYDNAYANYFKNHKKDIIKVEEFRKKKKEANKISLPEIEEYKNIIKDIELRNNKTIKKSKSVFNNKEKNEIVLKDKLIEELNNIYLDQKNLFLNNLKENYGDSKTMGIELYKRIINENIHNINKIKREPHIFVDGYSLLDGTINKKLKQYNYILGNKYHDRNVKEEKAEKFHQISDEFENTIKNNREDLINEKNFYKQLFISSLDFNKDKNEDMYPEQKIDFSKYKFEVINGNLTMGSDKVFKINNPQAYSENNNKEDINYNDYINFKNEYKNKYK